MPKPNGAASMTTATSFLALGCVGFIASAPAMAQEAKPAQTEKKLGGMIPRRSRRCSTRRARSW
jgi:hypothetical protein